MSINDLTDAVDKSYNHAKGVFAYIMEPRKKAEDFLVETIKNKGSLELSDIETASLIMIARKWTKKIKNNRGIINKANAQFEMLLLDGEKLEPTSVDEDWLDYFLDMSQYSSDEVVQEIWARLLVKEHIQNNTIPKAMINTLAMMDKQTAITFTNLCRLTVTYDTGETPEPFPLVIGSHMFQEMREQYPDDENAFKNYGDLIPSLRELEAIGELGLISVNSMQREHFIYFSEDRNVKLSYGDFEAVTDGIRDETDFKCLGTGLVFFTLSGMILFNTFIVNPFEDMPTIISRFIHFQETNKDKILDSLL